MAWLARFSNESGTIPVAALAVMLTAVLLACLTRLGRNSTDAVLRLDFFLPVLRRERNGVCASSSLIGRWIRRLLPSSLQSDRDVKRYGIIRRLLRRIGLSWQASPIRRIVQTLCLAVFLYLFFSVCWPYTAVPEPPGHVASGWAFSDIDQNSGDVILSGVMPSEWTLTIDDTVCLVDQKQPDELIGEFTVTDLSDLNVRLRLNGELTPELLDEFFTNTGPWQLQQNRPDTWPSHYADDLARKERIAAEFFLMIDPLVSLSTAVASRSWVWSLSSAACILIVCVLVPRGFCGYLCPLGTTIDLFDWAIAGRTKRFQISGDGWWVHIKYYLLSGTMICSVFGVLVSGFVSAIPVITRALLFTIAPLQTGSLRGWHLVPAMNAGHWISLCLFAIVLCLGFLRPRFWCKYVCPSGALFSIGNLFRATERKVESTCINCNKCVEICPFDAIKPDFTTRTTDCTMCQSCGGVCPTQAIKFVERWNVVELKVPGDPPTRETPLGRRGFVSLATGMGAAVAGGLGWTGLTRTWGAHLEDTDSFRPVRPPGSVPEAEFLQMCIRCGECFKACPNNVLQPEGFQQGLEGLWTPMVVADWAGCESSCNACGQVCPTGAIRPLSLEVKKATRMGLAIVNQDTCLPFAGAEACDLCVQECQAAGYNAIEFIQTGTETDDAGLPIEGTGLLAPVVLADKCVGCGLCQTRCHAINVKSKGLLSDSAIVVVAGAGHEDRQMADYDPIGSRRSTPLE